MKLKEIHENADVEIVDFDVDEAQVSGIHKIGSVTANYHDLAELFGEPQSFAGDRLADVNFLWSITIKYREAGGDYGEGEDLDDDLAFCDLYDYRRGDAETNPTRVEEWTIGGRNWQDGYVLQTLLQQKGVIK